MYIGHRNHSAAARCHAIEHIGRVDVTKETIVLVTRNDGFNHILQLNIQRDVAIRSKEKQNKDTTKQAMRERQLK